MVKGNLPNGHLLSLGKLSNSGTSLRATLDPEIEMKVSSKIYELCLPTRFYRISANYFTGKALRKTTDIGDLTVSSYYNALKSIYRY